MGYLLLVLLGVDGQVHFLPAAQVHREDVRQLTPRRLRLLLQNDSRDVRHSSRAQACNSAQAVRPRQLQAGLGERTVLCPERARNLVHIRPIGHRKAQLFPVNRQLHGQRGPLSPDCPHPTHAGQEGERPRHPF